MRIMLVDDHAGFRQVVRTLLEASEGEFLECEDGRSAVHEFPRFHPDLVLMDIAMKDLDGINATVKIKTAFPTARIFMLTQYDDPDLRLAAERAGAERYLLKEDLSQLQRLVKTVEPEPPGKPRCT